MRSLLSLFLLLSFSILTAQEQAFPLNSVHGSTKKALKIHVKNEAGEKSFLETHMPQGKIYLASVWATWCGPCRSELNAIQEVHKQWSDKYNFEFIAISIDKPTDHAKVFSMANRMGWDFKVVHDEYGYVARELDISAIPRMYLVDQEGQIVYMAKGYSKSALKLLESKISAL